MSPCNHFLPGSLFYRTPYWVPAPLPTGWKILQTTASQVQGRRQFQFVDAPGLYPSTLKPLLNLNDFSDSLLLPLLQSLCNHIGLIPNTPATL